MKRISLLFTLLPLFTIAQQTYVPDNNFEAYLETHDASGTTVTLGDPTAMGDGIIGNDSVTTANINTVTHLDISGGAGTAIGIFDLTGIEDFTALTFLSCYYNSITTLDLSNNVTLTDLDCSYNLLTSLDISDNSSLESLTCSENQLTSLDVSNNTALLYLYCNNNTITSLDVSNNTALINLWCYYNQLTCLNVKNGNNMNIVDFFASFNSTLICIEVDDPIYSTANWYIIDLGVTFNTNCNYPLGCFFTPITITENTNKFYLYPNPTTDLIKIEIEGYNGSVNIEVHDLTGRPLQSTTNTSISLRDYPKGVYVLKISYGNRVEAMKVVKD